MAAFGGLAVILVLHWRRMGFSANGVGWLLTATLAGDVALTLGLSSWADRWGRRKILAMGGWLMVAGALLAGWSGCTVLILLGAIVGVISPSGNEVGPFQAVEQAALGQIVEPTDRTRVLGWYHLAGFGGAALGSLLGGWGWMFLCNHGWTQLEAGQFLFGVYAGLGLIIVIVSRRLPASLEVEAGASASARTAHGTMPPATRRAVYRLSALFSLDALAGGFIVQSLLAYWLHVRFGVTEATLGLLFFGTHFLSGISTLLAASLARKIGLLRTMVFTHLPSNLLLIGVALMPTFPLAALLLLARHLISQMDVPARQAYLMALVPPASRSAANGIAQTARTLGAAAAPAMAGSLLAMVPVGAPLIVCGVLKSAYDVLLLVSFRRVHTPY